MGWTFHDLASLPEVYDIVWCKWPQREDKNRPGEFVRPVLVRETRIMQSGDVQYGAVLISYASEKGSTTNPDRSIFASRTAGSLKLLVFTSRRDFRFHWLIESCCLGARNTLCRLDT
jgi:hypothetical protein